MKILSLANQKGGVGKSTIAVHAAFYAAEAGARVLFVDLDSQANSSSTLQQFASPVQASALFHDKPISVPALPGPGIVLIAADPALVDLDRAPFEVIETFVKQLQGLGSQFDVCILDTAPAPGLRQLGALIASNFVVSPIELENYSIDGIERMLKTIYGVRQNFNSNLKYLGMLPNRFNSHSPTQKGALLDLMKHYSDRVLPIALTSRTSIAEALSERIPVWKMTKTSAREAGKEMRAVLEAIAKRMGGIGAGD